MGQFTVRLVACISSAELAVANFEFAERRNERNAELVEEKLISSNEKDEIETKALIAKLEARQAREKLNLRTIRSPIDGVVAEVDTAPGEHVSEDQMMRLAQLDPLNVEVVVPVSLYGKIVEGMSATVMPEFPFNQERVAVVEIVDTVVDAASGTFGVRLELPHPSLDLPGGLKCSVSFAEDLPGS